MSIARTAFNMPFSKRNTGNNRNFVIKKRHELTSHYQHSKLTRNHIIIRKAKHSYLVYGNAPICEDSTHTKIAIFSDSWYINRYQIYLPFSDLF